MRPEVKKLIIANLPYLLFVYLFGKLGQTYRLAAGADVSEKLLHLADGFSLAFENAAPSFHLFDLAVGVTGAVALRLMVYCKSKNAKKYRRGVEYGSARWGGPKDIRLIQQHLKFYIRRFIGTAIGRNEQLFIGLVRVLDVVQRLFQR